jgi:hypothetical protein
MATLLTPLAHNVPIVDDKGNPAPFFQRILQQLLKEKKVTDTLAEGAVQPTRLISTTDGLTGGGDLSADRTLGIDLTAEAERIRDVIGTALVAGTNITITVNDGGDTITIGAAAASGAWTLIETLSPAAATSINSEAWAGGSYKALKFLFRLTMSTDGTTLFTRYKLNGAYKTAANHRYTGNSMSSSTSTNAIASQTGTAIVIGNTGATWGVGNDTNEHITGEITIFRPFDTTKPKALNFQTEHGAPSGAYVNTTGGGVYDGTDALTALQGVQFLLSGGTMTGTISVLGLN